MTQRYLLAALAAMATMGASAQLTSFYAPSSVLSAGNWVKVGVTETGVYEISYDQLRAMGFSDPAKVGVYGRGGQMMPESFVDANGNPAFTDDLQSTGAIHINDRLYFYGLGTDSYTFTNDGSLPTEGKFVNNGKNIYSRFGYYFLTDSAPAPDMPMATGSHEDALALTEGVGLVYHEDDLEHNNSSSGRLFWGERFNKSNPSRYTWQVAMPDVLPREGVMDCIFYSTYVDASGGSIKNNWLRYGITDAVAGAEIPVKKFNTVNFRPQEPFYNKIFMNSDRAEVYVEGFITSADDANLDYWAISYPRRVPSMTVGGRRIAQDLIAFPGKSVGKTYKVTLPNPEGCVAIDVTDPARPSMLEIDENGNIYLPAFTTAPVMAVFDISKPQLQISGYEAGYSPVANQDLHALQGQAVDMAIICTPWLRTQAERIADLHRRLDGMNVVVADMNQVYNEFSGGIPDPMAYRSFVKMLYTASPETMKNLLLMGPVLGDVRGILVERDVDNALIGYQVTSQSIDKGAFNVNDFYGMMADYSATIASNPEQQTIHVGVGVLPFNTTIEADTYVNKLERYYSDLDEQVYTVGRHLFVGGYGDNHTHDIQARDLSRYADELAFNGLIGSLLPINAYGREKGRAKMLEYLDQGTGLYLYIGHGAADRLGWSLDFFNNSDAMRLKNRMMPFMLFAGCSLTNFDRGQRGLGEKIVLEAPSGAIASLCASRDTWSGQNQMLIRQLLTCMHRAHTRTADNKILYSPHDKVLTLGEIYANTKSISTYPNDQAYHLVGDPAVKIPLVVRTAILDETPSSVIPVAGNRINLRGKVTGTDGRGDSDFNGRMVARLICPQVDLVSADLVIQEDSIQNFVYRDTQASQASVDVKNGQFDVTLDIPASMSAYIGQTAYIYLSGLDHTTRNGMAMMVPVTIGDPTQSGIEPVVDVTPPVIESFVFDEATSSIRSVVADDVALDLSAGSMNPASKGFSLLIDGRYDRNASNSLIDTEDGSRRCIRVSPLYGLSFGNHTARLQVSDAAGNTSVSEMTFTYAPAKNSYNLICIDEAASEKAEFFFEGHAPASGRLVIETTSGKEIFTADINAEGYSWSLVDNEGRKVAPGRYKAYVVETGSHQTKGHSNTIDVAVI
ncbi:MAG: hypothetical protein K2O24_05130 [Muribaculaceae bacterium]|nr:hypothetical protein [Muribaculaceae bacterium]